MSNKAKAINSGKWITISTTISTVVQFVQIALLARLLDPSAFGIVSVSTSIIGLFSLFANLGFSNSIISKQEEDREVLSTLYYLNLALGFFIFLIIYLSSPWIVDFYDEPKLEKVVKVSSLYFLVVYIGQIYSFLMQKELKFKKIAIIDIVGVVIGLSITVGLAQYGFQEMSLIYGQLAMQTVKSLLEFTFGFRLFTPGAFFNISRVKEHLLFGVYNIGDGFLGFVQSNADRIIIGSMLGMEALGFYSVAFQLAIFPIMKLNPIVLQVAYPILAKMKENVNELRNGYLKILDIVSYANMPLLAGLFITANTVVPLIYGPKWENSIYLIQIFVFVSFFNCLCHPLYILAFTREKPKLLFYLNLCTLIVKIPLILVLGYYWQVMGVAVAFLLANISNFIVNFLMAKSLIGNFYKEFCQNLALPLSFCLVMVAAIYTYKHFIGYSGMLHAAAEIAIGGIVYLAFTFLFKLSFKEIKVLSKSF